MTGTSLLPLDTLAGTIKAHIAAGDKSIGKAEEHYKAAGLHLMEAKDRVKRTANLTWPAFLLSQCGIQARRANELIEIADGRKTLTEVREKKAKSQAATMAKYRSGTTGAQSSEKVQRDQSSPPDDDAPLRLPSDDEMKRIYDGAPEKVRTVVDAFLSLRRKERDTAWQLINLYDQLGGRPASSFDH